MSNYVREYLFDCDWYDKYRDEEIHSQGIVVANNYTEAMRKIEQRLTNVYNVHITEYEEMDFIWLSKELYDRISDPENEYGLEEPDEELEEIETCGPQVSPPDWPEDEKVDEDDEYWDYDRPYWTQRSPFNKVHYKFEEEDC